MGFFRRNGSKAKLVDDDVKTSVSEEQPPAPPPPSSPPKDVLVPSNDIICTVSETWRWLLEEALEEQKLSIVDSPAELPTAALVDVAESPPPTPSARRRKKKPASSCPLRVEVKNSEGRVLRAAHGNSEAFDGLEDKDELVRTLQRCRCEHLELSPPSRLVNWDVTKEECNNIVGKDMPTLLGNEGAETFAVLKEPMGSRGDGIFFVRNADEVHAIIDEHKKEAMAKPNFLDDLIASKGRIPSWVLQAEVRPCLLIRNRKKFHIRSYVVGVEQWDIDELMDTYLYKRHEVRIAREPVPDDEGNNTRDKAAHVTNGVKETELLHQTPELKDLQDQLEGFIAKIFAKHLIQDLSRRVAVSAREDSNSHVTKFVVAGLDIMVTEDKRLYLLEANVVPIMPPSESLKDEFQIHFIGFMRDLVGLVVGNQTKNFVSCKSLLAKHDS